MDTTTELVHTERHAGEELTIELETTTYSSDSTHIRLVATADHSGRLGGVRLTGEAIEKPGAAIVKLLGKARRDLELVQQDARLRPLLEVLATTDAGPIEPGIELPVIGDVVRLHSRGTTRYGIVVKVTRTGTATAAYVTPGGIEEARRYRHASRVTRKAAKFGDYEVIRWTPAELAARAAAVTGELEVEAR